jgi:O-acetyl-ADP-ribose deacetylase (regulator of RNase III)
MSGSPSDQDPVEPGTLTCLTGDATEPVSRPAVIAHVCNDYGGWGRGFVVALSRRWPEPEQEYRRWRRQHGICRGGVGFHLGAVQRVRVADDLVVVNMIAQHGNRSADNPVAIRYDALGRCLSQLAWYAWAHDMSVHMPRIGCGLGGGDWAEIEPLIVEHLCSRGIDVFVYDLSAT